MSNNEAQLMANKICQYISERCNKKELFLLKDKPDKKGKGGINNRLEQLAYILLEIGDEQLEKVKSLKKEKVQNPLEFQQVKYLQYLSLLNNFQDNEQLIDIVSEYRDTLQELKLNHEATVWLNDWANKAKDISFATHVAKLTHSSSRSTSIYDRTISINSEYLTTSIIKDAIIDTATANSASAPAGEILTLRINHQSLLDFIKKNDSSPFNELSKNPEEIKSWMKKFNQAYEKEHKNSHFLSKQVYFPIKEQEYHILMPLVSSSIAHEFYLRKQKLFDEDNVLAIKQQGNDKYHYNLVISFPNKANLKVPGKPQTASSLNSDRNGNIIMFSSLPPTWQTQLKPPIHNQSLFEKCFSSNIKENVDYLRHFLLRFKNLELSINKLERLEHLDRWINNIIDDVFFYIATIQNLPAGWSSLEGIKLTQAHQYLLDPFREDDEFKKQRSLNDWQEIICTDFAKWLNRKLTGIDKQFTPQAVHTKMWKKRFKEPLRLDIESLNIVMKQEKVGANL